MSNLTNEQKLAALSPPNSTGSETSPNVSFGSCSSPNASFGSPKGTPSPRPSFKSRLSGGVASPNTRGRPPQVIIPPIVEGGLSQHHSLSTPPRTTTEAVASPLQARSQSRGKLLLGDTPQTKPSMEKKKSGYSSLLTGSAVKRSGSCTSIPNLTSPKTLMSPFTTSNDSLKYCVTETVDSVSCIKEESEYIYLTPEFVLMGKYKTSSEASPAQSSLSPRTVSSKYASKNPEDECCDARVHADFSYEQFVELDTSQELLRYGSSPDDEGECNCDRGFITKDVRGFDYSKYHAHELFHHCDCCGRRPSVFLCIHCLKSFCGSHVEQHHACNPTACTLFINILDIMTSYDRVFWCEKCRRFTWKYTEEYEPFTDQIAFTRGTYLSEAVRDVHVTGFNIELGGSRNDSHALRALGASVQGWRATQEDSESVFVMQLAPSVKFPLVSYSVQCVFDGHGGEVVARIAATLISQHIDEQCRMAIQNHSEDENIKLHQALLRSESSEVIQKFFEHIFSAALTTLDQTIRDTEEGKRGDYNCVGCTACIVAISRTHIICANLGDSGAALFNPDKLTPLSSPHRLSDTTESQRVKNAGYSIRDDRIEGLLAVPRALGDYDFKQCGGKSAAQQAVTPVPDLTIQCTPTDVDWGVIVACDGVWDTASAHQVHLAVLGVGGDVSHSDVVRKHASCLDTQLLRAATNVFIQCVAPSDNDEGIGLDNVSLILVRPEKGKLMPSHSREASQ